MRLLELTLDSPAGNLALDEALLDEAEAAGRPSEAFRLWEPAEPLVVLGRSSQVALETRAGACQTRGIPILRRSSGGAAILTGPGCLMYAVVLSFEFRPELRPLDAAHAFVLDTLLKAIRPYAPQAARQGTSDLTLGPRKPLGGPLKFSGNALRCKRTHFLYHGTLLYDMPLELIAACLAEPPKQPDYRARREHGQFVTNLPVTREQLRESLIAAWQPLDATDQWPRDRVEQLVAEKYSQPAWNLRH